MKQAETASGRGEYHRNTEQGKGGSNFRQESPHWESHLSKDLDGEGSATWAEGTASVKVLGQEQGPCAGVLGSISG